MKTLNLLRAVLGIIATLTLILLNPTVIANPMGQAEMRTDRPGKDYHHFQANHFSVCATSCATNAQCRAYTYVNSSHTCWLKDSVPKRKSNGCCISGVKLMSAAEFNVDRPGSNIKPGFSVVTNSQCESQCVNDTKCRAYTFVKPGIQGESAKCWLKHSKPRKVANGCCISGYRITAPPRHQPDPRLQSIP